MSIKVYNTLARRKEEFIPVTPGQVKMYVCGVTPYNHSHIGNIRPPVVWDVIRRYLEYRGYKVLHVQNFTDVDDKIINTAKQENCNWDELAERYTAAYYEITDKLGVRRAHVYPKVSEHMPEIIAMVSGLVDKGYAYVIDGDVYYSVQSFADYGQLSGRSIDDMQAGARVAVDDRKHHPMDFALWKAAKPGEPAWDSPWGAGRPGWHIECSAMSIKYLGESFDFHGGGSDLRFPHHENEIAQNEGFTGVKPFVRYWLHNGFVTIDEEKMSKTLGNFFLVKDIIAKYEPEILRFLIISAHYRSPLDFGDERLIEAEKGLSRLRVAQESIIDIQRMPVLEEPKNSAGDELLDKAKQAMADFEQAMDDDFNTALALAAMFGLAKEINIYKQHLANDKSGQRPGIFDDVSATYLTMAGILGILQSNPGLKTAGTDMVDQLLALIMEVRQSARERKDWASADIIRKRLGEMGFIIEDSPQGAKWKHK